MDLAFLQQQQQQQQPNKLDQHFNKYSHHQQLLFSNETNRVNSSGGGHYKQLSQPIIQQSLQLQQQQQPALSNQQTVFNNSLHRPSRSVIHMRENSMDELDALFDPSKWSNRRTSNSNLPPLAKRNLPLSFFRPPEAGTKTPKLSSSSSLHSRQSSVDQTNVLNNSNLLNQQQHSFILQQKLSCLNNNSNYSNGIENNVNNVNCNSNLINGLNQQNLHSRSISEPVSVIPPYLLNKNPNQLNKSPLVQQQQPGNSHLLPSDMQQQLNCLPYGWQVAYTANGQRYFINHLTKETSWTLPSPSSAQESFVNSTSSSFDLNNTNMLSLFERQHQQQQQMHLLKSNDAFFSSSSTSSSPLIAKVDNVGLIQTSQFNSSVANTEMIIQNNNSSSSSSTSSMFPLSSSASVSASDDDLLITSDCFQFQQQKIDLHNKLEKLESHHQLESILNQIEMPAGWEKAQTNKGEVYFINHITKSTYWEDPRLSLIPNFLKQQKQQQNLLLNGNSVASCSFNNLNETTVGQHDSIVSNTQQQNEIKDLIIDVISKKKELLKSLEELNKQESFLRAQLDSAMLNLSNCYSNGSGDLIQSIKKEQRQIEDDDDEDDQKQGHIKRKEKRLHTLKSHDDNDDDADNHEEDYSTIGIINLDFALDKANLDEFDEEQVNKNNNFSTIDYANRTLISSTETTTTGEERDKNIESIMTYTNLTNNNLLNETVSHSKHSKDGLFEIFPLELTPVNMHPGNIHPSSHKTGIELSTSLSSSSSVNNDSNLELNGNNNNNSIELETVSNLYDKLLINNSMSQIRSDTENMRAQNQLDTLNDDDDNDHSSY